MNRDSAEDHASLGPARRRTIYQGKVVDLGLETARLPNGESWELEVVRHPGAAAVLPVSKEGEAILVRQWRHAAEGWLLEVPAGKLDPGEEPEACARRETEEETGTRAHRLHSLGWIWTTPGFTDEKIWLYLATELEAGAQQLEADELLTVVRVPLEQAVRMAFDGGIEDGKSICTILRAWDFLRAEWQDGPHQG